MATEQLQDCFETTEWDIFRDEHTTIHEYTDTVSEYIKFCEDVCVPKKTVTFYPNSKAWVDKDIKRLISEKDKAYRNRKEEPTLFRQTKAKLKKAIKEAKNKYKDKIEDLFSSGQSKQMWANMNTITQYKGTPKTTECDDPTLPDRLNVFYARFDKDNKTSPVPLPSNDSPPFVVDEHDVRRSFSKLKVNKAAGPDKLTTKLLKVCSAELAPVFTVIFNWSLETCSVPTCLKKSTIVPVPKKQSPQTLNDYRPVALTSVAMKCFESIVLKFLNTLLPSDFDDFQFAYRSNRSVDDAIAINVHEVLNHLELSKSYARILFIDYSSAFNTIIPQQLYNKLNYQLSFPVNICNWILDFLLERPQEVKISNNVSTSITLNTGTPQGCPLSPKLYSIFTYDCKAEQPGCLVIKYADDTTVTGLIKNADEHAYRSQIDTIVSWCSQNNLHLNVSKTKEMIIDFRRNEPPPPPLVIQGSNVERVYDFKFLGTVLSNELTWDINCTDILKKARQRMYFLRKLKSCGVNKVIMTNFYRAIIESILTRSIEVWFDRLPVVNLHKLESVVKNAEKIIGTNLKSLETLYQERLTGKMTNIMKDKSHPSRHYFEFLPHGRRLRAFRGSSRFVNSCYPQAVKLFNNTRQKRLIRS